MKRAACFIFLISMAAQAQPRYPTVRATNTPPVWRLDSIATFSDSGVGFRSLNGVLVDPKGGVVLLDRRTPAVYRFDDRGSLIRIVGRKGSGPKEYLEPQSIGWMGGDLAIYDPGNGRLVRWTRDGEWVAQWGPLARVTGMIPMYTADSAHVWLMSVTPGIDGRPRRTFVRFPPTPGQDTILQPPPAARVAGSGVDCRWGDGMITGFSNPFVSRMSAVHPTPSGRLVESRGGEYRIAIKSGPTDTLRVLTRDVPPVRVTAAEWQDSTKEYRTFKSEHPLANCTGTMTPPAVKPSVVDMLIDDRGRIWIERIVPNGTQFDVWENDRLVASVPGIPGRARGSSTQADIRGDRIAVTRTDADGGYVVVLYHVVAR